MAGPDDPYPLFREDSGGKKVELPRSLTCGRIDFDQAEIVPGIISDTWFLIVSGTKPWLNMRVELSPLIYIKQPEYWGIEVVGCTNGIGLPRAAPYHIFLSLAGFTGTKGIEVIGETRKERREVVS